MTGLQPVTPPAIEPVSLTELKDHLRIDSGDITTALDVQQTVLAGSHGVGAAVPGATIDVLGYTVLVILVAGTCPGAGTVDVKLQDSLNGTTWIDVAPGGTFPHVDSTNDELTYELAYSGGKHYLRAMYTVANVACAFGVAVILRAPISIEDSLLSGFITAARDYCEQRQGRAYITQTWEFSFDEWPEIIELPKPPLQLVDSINYYGTDGLPHLIAPTAYQVDDRGYKARVVPIYGTLWPTVTLQPLSGLVVKFTAGYGAAAANVPERVRLAIKLLAGHLYEHREATDIKEVKEVAFAVNAFLGVDSLEMS